MINVNYTNVNSQYNRQKPDIKVDFSALQMESLDQSTGMVGKLIPVQWRELLPGQKVRIDQQIGVQFTPWVSNVLTPFEGRVMTYFVPTRLIYPTIWEDFITTGEKGISRDPNNPPVSLPLLPLDSFAQFIGYTDNEPDNQFKFWVEDVDYNAVVLNPDTGRMSCSIAQSLWDYFGLPVGVFSSREGDNVNDVLRDIDSNRMPISALFDAYNLIWNDVLRFPDISRGKRNVTSTHEGTTSRTDLSVQTWYWANDYFTRSRIYQMRGEMPMIPIVGLDNVTASASGLQELAFESESPASFTDADGSFYVRSGANSNRELVFSQTRSGPDVSDKTFTLPFVDFSHSKINIDVSDPSIGITINDFLLALSIGRFEMNSAKIIPRYGDYLRDRWHTDPLDSRLQLPEFVGSWSFGVDINGVVQTSGASEADVQAGRATPQGNITSIGQATPKTRSISFSAPEHGYIISIMCVRPLATYDGGMSRFLMRRTPFDFATPELYNTPDVQNNVSELFWTPWKNDEDTTKKPFGWMGIYDEYRTCFGKVSGYLRPSLKTGLKSYTLARYWTSDNLPALNDEFCLCRPDMARIKSFPKQPDFLFFFENQYNTAIPIPFESDPAVFANL
nr:major capsid protein [Rattus norvegicus microvirus]